MAIFSVQGRACVLNPTLEKQDVVFVTLSARPPSRDRRRPQSLTVRGFVPLSKFNTLGQPGTFSIDGYERGGRGNAANVAEFSSGCRPSEVASEAPSPDPPANAGTAGAPDGWPPYFRAWYVYQGYDEIDRGRDTYPNYANYSGYPAPEKLFVGDRPQTRLPTQPKVVPVMVATTAVQGGGVVRALVPNPLRKGARPRIRTYRRFPYVDPNGGCRPSNALRGRLIVNSSTPTARWALIGVRGAGSKELIGFVPTQDRDPFASDPLCGTG